MCIFSSAMAENGISLGASRSFLCSLSATAATLVGRLSAMPQDIFANVFIEQGMIAVASTLKEPLDMDAAMLSATILAQLPECII